MADLVERIKAARKVTITVDHMRFYATRPTLEALYEIHKNNPSYPDIAREYVNGWDGVRECDLLLEGSKDVVAFSQGLFEVALADCPHIWQAIGRELISEAALYFKKLEDYRKNLQAG